MERLLGGRFCTEYSIVNRNALTQNDGFREDSLQEINRKPILLATIV